MSDAVQAVEPAALRPLASAGVLPVAKSAGALRSLPAARCESEPEPLDGLSRAIDRALHAGAARLTAGISPAAIAQAYLDWGIHLAFSPGKQIQVATKALRKVSRLLEFSARCMVGGKAAPCIEPLPQDRRFAAPEWQQQPFNLIYQTFLLHQQWWANATTGVDGVSRQHESLVEFTTRQILDTLAPSNFIATNPLVQKRILETGGRNLVTGWQNAADDWLRWVSGKPPAGAEAFEVGRELATTPGQVVFRNRLIELIQYAPTTETVRSEPILIVPAWIMKYYILDLTAEDSLVRFLTAQGFTVFMISWKNPTEEDRDLSLEDYARLGVLSAIERIGEIAPGEKVHAVGYCLGGTLLTATAAAMAREGDDRLRTISLFAAQQDFTEAGELSLFINDSQIHFLEDLMWAQGYLEGRQMGGTFQILRSNDLIWSRLVHQYLMGENRSMNALMAWNADATRMPARMHGEYLRRLYRDNDLAEDRFPIGGKPVAISDIRAPIFALGTERDHVAPWRSAFKIHFLSDTDVTFLLTSGGHNSGIVSPPGAAHRSYRMLTKLAQDRHLDPDSWLEAAVMREGSWWPAFAAWLADRSGPQVPARQLPPLGPANQADRAPGTFVLAP